MKVVKFIASHAMPALMILFAIVIGLTTALISGCIEFVVIEGIISTVTIKSSISSTIVALLTVVCLEGTKVFLHIFIGIVEKRGTSDTLPNDVLPLEWMKKVRIALVALSITCTFVWTTNILYADLVNVDDQAYLEDIAQIEEMYDEKIDALWDSEAQIVKDRLSVYINAVNSATAEYEEYQVKDYNSRVFNETNAEKVRLKGNVDQAQTNLIAAQKDIPNEVHEYLLTQENELKSECTVKIQERNSQITNNEGANKYIHVVLMAVAHYLFELTSYAPQAYFMVAIIFSVVLSILLEAIIRVNLQVITLSQKEFDTLIQADNMSSEMEVKLNMMLRAFMLGIVSTLIFLFYCMWKDIVANINMVSYALIIFALVNLVAMRIFPRSANIPSNSLQTNTPRIKATVLYNEAVIAIVKACSSFLGFVLLGALFGSDFQELTMPAVGMTVGSIAGHLIKLPEKT